MENPAARPIIANNSMRKQLLGGRDNHLRRMLFRSGRGVACPYAVCV